MCTLDVKKITELWITVSKVISLTEGHGFQPSNLLDSAVPYRKWVLSSGSFKTAGSTTHLYDWQTVEVIKPHNREQKISKHICDKNIKYSPLLLEKK